MSEEIIHEGEIVAPVEEVAAVEVEHVSEEGADAPEEAVPAE